VQESEAFVALGQRVLDESRWKRALRIACKGLERAPGDEAAGIAFGILQEGRVDFVDEVRAQHAHPSIAAQPLEEGEPHRIAQAMVEDLPAHLAHQPLDAAHGLDGARYGRRGPTGLCPAPATAGGDSRWRDQ